MAESVCFAVAVIRRDFGEKAPTDVGIAGRVKAGEYKTRCELCRDLVLNRFWVNRYTLTMYETCWGHLPRQRDDVFLPVRSKPATGHCLHHGTKNWVVS